MTLTGEYTQAGAELAAQIQAGAATLTLTRAAAGPGMTTEDAAAMADEKQALSVQAHSLSGTTLTVPVQLLSLEAAEAYNLREIGLYARNAAGGEILYKIYRFDQAVGISPQSALTAIFYLNDTVAAGSQPSVLVTAQGMLTGADIPDIINQTLAKGVLTDSDIPTIVTQAITQSVKQTGAWEYKTESISCTASQLMSKINGLSKLIGKNVVITVTDAGDISDTQLNITGFYGPGTLTVSCAHQIPVSLIQIWGNRLQRITVENVRAGATGGAFSTISPSIDSYSKTSVAVRDCMGLVDLRKITISPPNSAPSSAVGVYVDNSHCVLTDYMVTSRGLAIMGHRMARITFRSFSSTGSFGLSYVFRLYNGSMLTWPGTTSTLSAQTGCSNYSCASGAVAIFGGGTLNVASGFTSTEA